MPNKLAPRCYLPPLYCSTSSACSSGFAPFLIQNLFSFRAQFLLDIFCWVFLPFRIFFKNVSTTICPPFGTSPTPLPVPLPLPQFGMKKEGSGLHVPGKMMLPARTAYGRKGLPARTAYWMQVLPARTAIGIRMRTQNLT